MSLELSSLQKAVSSLERAVRERNETAHTYDAKTAEDVYETAIRFAVDARAFLKILGDKND